jgi:peptidoglycan/xylan/chitin deacetylase (PgdA/CDA1 family)
VTHFVTLSFDDGFERSSIRTAEIFERYGLVAELNVLAGAHHAGSDDPWHSRWPVGDFALWRDLAARGHALMPHGYRHADKSKLPLEEAKALIELCLDVFGAELPGFEVSQATFAFPYNNSTAELEAWLGTRVRAFRTRGEPVMALPPADRRRIGCAGFGPDPADDHLVETVETLLAGPPAWLCYNLHGLDDEGWGPVRSDTLCRVLERLLEREAGVLPITGVLDAFAGG